MIAARAISQGAIIFHKILGVDARSVLKPFLQVILLLVALTPISLRAPISILSFWYEML